MYYSQYKQDEFLHKNFFINKIDGFFVDIGAHDGITLSNSKFFEELGWNGICVEPIPSVFQKLINNRKCKCINAAISDKNEEIDFLICEGYTEMLSGILDKYNPIHLSRLNNEIHIYGGKKEIIKVKSMRLEDIVSHNQKIDILSIDTEGSEYDILKSINFEKYEIDFIVFENPYFDHDFDNILGKKYKKIFRLECDDIYKKIN